jgi:TPR repeat protein
MRIEKLFVLAAFLGLAGSLPALADTTVTITTNSVDCQVPPPAEVAAPATPSTAAGTAAAKNRNFALARANFKPLAESGNPESERLYGMLLMEKCTGIQDKDAAASWLAKAVDGGDTVALTNLGQAYMNGEGLAEDDGKAFALLSRAAAAGQAPAELSLGYLYFTGRGVASDLYQGVVWTVKAGEQGLPAALFNISHGYFKGEALTQDNDKAAYYMFAAIERSTPVQKGRFAGDINSVSRALSAQDLSRAASKARRWSPGPGSLSDVLDDANRARARAAKN